MTSAFDTYLRKLRETPLAEHTEHTGRAALEELLNTFAARADVGGVVVQHEPKRQADKGAPDFKVTRSGMILGYVEVKEIGTNLDRVRKSKQIKKYLELSENIILTDYLNWMWLGPDGTVKHQETLAYASDLEGRTVRVRDDRAESVSKLLSGFFSAPPLGIARARELALALAARSRLLRDYLGEELVRQGREHKEGRLHGLYEVFKKQVFHELTLAEFADAFAQMLAYGLFLARLNSDAENVTLDNARQYVPTAFELIRELVDFIGELQKAEYQEVRWVVEEIVSIVNGLDLRAIHEDLSFRQRRTISRGLRAADEEEHRLFERDPFIYFYEDFLKAYDPATRKGRGVYYTPPPVVNFIVRAIDDILKDTFEIADGLADNKAVTVLDFACGTGTFLLEVFQQALANVGGPQSGTAGPLVHEHFLKNVFGFEYLIAPYTIAHLKLSQYLLDQGHPLRDGERLQVFLTNTLEPVEPQKNLLLPAVAAEVQAAQDVKDQPILVITGNPPYSGHSKNKGAWITSKIEGYKYTTEVDDDGNEYRKPLGERNPKWLNDDYVKFIRFAQLKMDEVEEGVVGVITNHSWLDNPTFRGMRQSLMSSFEQIYVFDLHGSSKPKEFAPNGAENENVFDIQKGVAIALFVKRQGLERGVYYADVWGSRLEKYRAAASSDLANLPWHRVDVRAPYYMFRPMDWTDWPRYQEGWPLSDSLNTPNEKKQLIAVNVLGFQTHRDEFAIGFDRADILTRLHTMQDVSVPDQVVRERYGLKDNRDWKLERSRALLRDNIDAEVNVVECSYRPFDIRHCYFGAEFMDYPRRELVDHVANRQNLVLLASRQTAVDAWRHVAVSNRVAESCYVSDGTTEQNYCFPVWLFDESGNARENLTSGFRAFIDAHYGHHYTAEEILGYIYAVLHAPTFRYRYTNFLRIDFPRIPFAKGSEHFEALSALGWALVQAHLLKTVPRQRLAQFHGQGDQTVEYVRYAEANNTIGINSTQRFGPVPPEIWNFHIGGYQVLDKYLKSRRGRTLSLDEINHVSAVADSLAFTIEQMAAIDEAYRAAFSDRG